MKQHLLQSEIWEKFEKMEGRQTWRLKGAGFEALAVEVQRGTMKYLLVKYGPSYEGMAGLRRALAALAKLAKKEGMVFVRVEPTRPLSAGEAKKLNLVKTKDLDPAETWVLDLGGEKNETEAMQNFWENGADLTESEQELVAGMESNKVRSWRNAGKRGIWVRKTKNPEEIRILIDLLKKVGARDHFTPQDEEHLKNQMRAGFATLYIAELVGDGAAVNDGKPGRGPLRAPEMGLEAARRGLERAEGKKSISKAAEAQEAAGGAKKPIAAALVYDYDGVRYYAHAGTDGDYAKLRAGAVLSVETILEAKRAGMRIYDFWGMTKSEDPQHPWYGFTQYKKSFGGREVDYAGTYDLVVEKGKYKLYEGLRKVNLKLRKLKK